MTRGEAVIAFVQEYCTVPEGAKVGQPVRLADFQKKFILAVYDNKHVTDTAILSIARKNAKALTLETPIPTPRGWRAMGDIKAGDYVFAPDGEPVEVLVDSEIFTDKECYRVHFSDGSYVDASGDHIWTTRHKYRPWEDDGGKPKYNRRPITANVTTDQIRQSLEIPRTDGGTERNHSVQVSRPLQFQRREFEIPPYVLGAWLGDGKSNGASLTCSEQDAPAMMARLSEFECGVKLQEGPERAPTIAISDDAKTWHEKRESSLHTRLKRAGLLNNKHIPEQFFTGSETQRWELLQGLMDTDGTVNRNGGRYHRCSFCNKNERLANDVWRLCKTLGLKASIKTSRSKLNGEDFGRAYKVEFAAKQSEPVFSLKRKQSLLPQKLGNRSRTNQIISVEPLGIKPCKCIAVNSEDRLFLAGSGCVPTHNTGTIAFLLLAHLVGPEAVQNSRIVSGARSREQASEVYNLASKCVQLSPKLRDYIHEVPSKKMLVGLPMNVEYQAISAEGKTAHGKSPILAILDEVGQIKGPQDDFVDAITTAQGAYDDPLLIYISTQAATDADLFSVLIDDAKKHKPPKTVCHVYAADKDADVMDEKAWKAANPALGLFRSENDMRKQAEKAARMPSFENTFRNLNLNQRVSTVSPFVSKAVWQGCAGEVGDFDGEVWAGLDLSGRTDLTSLVVVGHAEGKVRADAYFWTPEDGLFDRAKRDRQPYDVWAKEGYLRTTPGATVDYDFVAAEMAEILGELELVTVAFDRWRIDVLQKAFDRMGLELPMQSFGQGFKDMSPAIDKLEELLLNKRLRHGEQPVLTMCAANAVITKDPAGNRKLDKHKATGRIDGMVALSMAVGVMETAEGNDDGAFDEFLLDPISV